MSQIYIGNKSVLQFSSWKFPLFIVATVQNREFYIFKFPSQLFLRRGLVVCLFKSQVAEIEGKFERNSIQISDGFYFDHVKRHLKYHGQSSIETVSKISVMEE